VVFRGKQYLPIRYIFAGFKAILDHLNQRLGEVVQRSADEFEGGAFEQSLGIGV
jgi:hypothetical protein